MRIQGKVLCDAFLIWSWFIVTETKINFLQHAAWQMNLLQYLCQVDWCIFQNKGIRTLIGKEWRLTIKFSFAQHRWKLHGRGWSTIFALLKSDVNEMLIRNRYFLSQWSKLRFSLPYGTPSWPEFTLRNEKFLEFNSKYLKLIHDPYQR